MTSVDSKEKNLKQIISLIEQIPSDQNYHLACFPENSIYMRLKEGEKVAGIPIEDPTLSKLAEVAKQRKLMIHLGSIPLLLNNKVYNSSISISTDGVVKPSYQKMHLFDITLDGQPPFRESDVFTHGNTPEIFEVSGWNIGQTICYDIRFAEIYNYYAQHSVEVILVPAAFLVPTGRAHWEILLRARAIESQTYILAAAQAGTHQGENGGLRETFGHSMIIDPWGTVIAQSKTMGPEILTAQLSLPQIQKIRKQIPMRDHRRLVQVKR